MKDSISTKFEEEKSTKPTDSKKLNKIQTQKGGTIEMKNNRFEEMSEIELASEYNVSEY